MRSRSTASPPIRGSRTGLARLPGRKFVFTNGDAPYARRVLEAIGVDDHFDELHDIHASDLRPKPDPHGYALLCERFAIDPKAAVLVEDMAQNLKPAKALGMTTVWVDNGSERGAHVAEEGHVDYRHRRRRRVARDDLGGMSMNDCRA